jgi:hypothetical protein
MILEGDIAELVLRYLLDNYEGEGRYVRFPHAGYFKEGDKYTCFDNTGFCCFVEQTEDLQKAISWCKNEIDTTDLYFIES